MHGVATMEKTLSASQVNRLLDTRPSSLTLGTVQLGLPYGVANKSGQPSETEAIRIIQTALQSGVTHLDTAQAYGDSERIIGLALRGRQERPVIVTKLDPLTGIASDAPSHEVIKLAEGLIYRSLALLGAEQLDVLMLHRWEHRRAWDEALWNQLLELKRQGLIGALGVSVTSPEQALDALRDPDVSHIQLPYNLLDWRWKRAGVPDAVKQRPDVVIYARSALLQGILVTDSEAWPRLRDIPPQFAAETAAEIKSLVQQLERLSPIDLALAYVRSQPWIDSVVVGVETLAQLEENIKLFDTPLLSKSQVELVETRFLSTPEFLLDPSNWNQKSFDISLRPVTAADCRSVFEWRNHESTRRFIFDPQPIAWEDHQQWFNRTLDDPDRILLIGESEGQPVGVLRYDRLDDTMAEVSIYLVPERQGQGYGTVLLQVGTEYMRSRYSWLKHVRAQILSDNTASRKAFEKAGYVPSLLHYIKTIHPEEGTSP